jgi:hypothetical protein
MLTQSPDRLRLFIAWESTIEEVTTRHTLVTQTTAEKYEAMCVSEIGLMQELTKYVEDSHKNQLNLPVKVFITNVNVLPVYTRAYSVGRA